jgi:hypothetical protein
MEDLAADNGVFLTSYPHHISLDFTRDPQLEFSTIRADGFKEFELGSFKQMLAEIAMLPIPPTSIGTVPLIDVLPAPKQLIQKIVSAMVNTEVATRPGFHIFRATREKIVTNFKTASGHRADANVTIEKIVMVHESRLSGTALVDAYLGGTPWADFLKCPIPFEIPMARRLEHTVIVAGAGWGKTELLKSIILTDLKKPNPPALIVLDSTGAMIRDIQQLALFNGPLRDRLVIIDPQHSPALNMFDVATPRFQTYSEEQREDVQSEIISLFNYIFATESYGLTARMDTAFSYAVKLIMSMPSATITDLRQLLEEPAAKVGGYQHSAFKHYIDQLDQDARDFFATHFYSQSLTGTRLNVAQRLHKVVGVPAFRRMFTASTNVLDLYADMQAGKIILVNTNQQLLKEDSHILFGRYIIARALAAAFERATLLPEQRNPAFLIVDEAAPYFDQTFESLLTRVRQFKLGVVIAFQHLEQANEKLRSAIASSTAVKFGANVGFQDRRWLAREMETTPEFIQGQRQRINDDEKWTQFAAHVRNVTPHAHSVTVEIGLFDKEPKMTELEHLDLIRRCMERVAFAPSPSQQEDHAADVIQPSPQPNSQSSQPKRQQPPAVIQLPHHKQDDGEGGWT